MMEEIEEKDTERKHLMRIKGVMMIIVLVVVIIVVVVLEITVKMVVSMIIRRSRSRTES